MTITNKLAAVRAGLVKPLEWQRSVPRDSGSRAETIIGTYHVWTYTEAEAVKWFWRLRDGLHIVSVDHAVAAEAEAKAAAQADYRERILPALDLTATDALVRERDEAREQVMCRDLTYSELASRADALAAEVAALKGLVGEAEKRVSDADYESGSAIATAVCANDHILHRLDEQQQEEVYADVQRAVLRELRQRRAAEAEPVAWLAAYVPNQFESVFRDRQRAIEASPTGEAIPLYATPPAAEPTDAEVEAAAWELARLISRRSGGFRPDDYMNDDRREEARVALRAALSSRTGGKA